MAARIAMRVHRAIIPGLALVATPINAVTSTDDAKKPKLLRPSELPIYDDDANCHCSGHSVVPEVTRLERELGRLRHFVVDSLDALTDSKDRAVAFYETGKAHTIDSVAYLREESNLLARIGAISFGGLTGILIGARGGFFKKFLYGSAGMAAAASLCYPKEAGQISKGAYTIAKYYAYVSYNKVEDEVRSRSRSEPTTAAQKPQEQKSPAVAVPPPSKAAEKKIDGDFGQSNPEDRDLYSTRGS